MEVHLLKNHQLADIPSGSGIAKYGKGYYVIGDDSPYLYFLDQSFDVISKIVLSENQDFTAGRIVKAEKADFETLELINEKELVVFGSGSKSPQRDVFVRILLEEEVSLRSYDLFDFYEQIRKLPILKDSELNIEATAYLAGALFLFNRRKNLIIKFNYQSFLNFIEGKGPFPELEIQEYDLPKIEGIEAGFSGATTLQNEAKIIFTASVENNLTAYEDGEILGSIIGMIDLSDGEISKKFEWCEIPNGVDNFKVESVTIEEEIVPGKTKLVLITDDDDGNSVILETLLLW